MAYRTYRNLYRIRPALTSIGTGKGRIRLPKGIQITMDTFILALVFWLPCSFLFGAVLQYFLPFPKLIIGFLVSGVISFQLDKIDPAGKTVVVYIFDMVRFFFRRKEHNGFEFKSHPAKAFDPSWQIPVALLEDNKVGSLPARGHVTDFELLSPLAVKVKKERVTIQYQGECLPQGKYTIEHGKVIPASKRSLPISQEVLEDTPGINELPDIKKGTASSEEEPIKNRIAFTEALLKEGYEETAVSTEEANELKNNAQNVIEGPPQYNTIPTMEDAYKIHDEIKR